MITLSENIQHFLCHRSMTWNSLPPDTRNLSTNIPFQAQNAPLKNCISSLGSFPSPLTVYPDFDSCYSHILCPNAELPVCDNKAENKPIDRSVNRSIDRSINQTKIFISLHWNIKKIQMMNAWESVIQTEIPWFNKNSPTIPWIFQTSKIPRLF